MQHKGVETQEKRPLPSPNPAQPNQLIGFKIPQKAVMGLILITALFAFELFNFDTTRYALGSLLGNISFWGIQWATILALAFCAIDFAGLARLFTPERNPQEPRAVWYLMGAWLLGATMNAVMTWWAISLTLLSHEFGNEILSREQLLRWVPFFVATLVWLTRILFIGAISIAGEYMFDTGQVRGFTSRLGTAVQRSTQLVPSQPSRPNLAGMRAKSANPQAPRTRPGHARRPASPPKRQQPPQRGGMTRRVGTHRRPAAMQAKQRR